MEPYNPAAMNRPPLPLPPSTSWIDTDAGLAEALSELREAGEFGFDTEADSYYVYHIKVCLLQISSRTWNYLIDPLAALDLTPFGELLANPQYRTVVHAGFNDVGLLRHHYQFEFANLFDTMLSAQVLGLRRPGLASLLSERFQVEQKKSYQTSDWRKRPLTRGQLFYAIQDTAYLLPLMDQLQRELEEKGRREEAEEEFEKLLDSGFSERKFDPETFLRAKGARELTPLSLQVLNGLAHHRDRTARRRDRSPHLVYSDRTLVEVARRRPRTLEQLRRVKGVSDRQIERDGPRLLEVIDRSLQEGPLHLPKKRKTTPSEPPLNRGQKTLFESLRNWRKNRAKERDVQESRVATSGTLRGIARAFPKTLDELAAVDGMTRFRIKEYGEEILALIHRPR